jgi:hypothetical protein
MPRISADFFAERHDALQRVLRGLPGDFLAALVQGLEDADVIVGGRLFAGYSGGCAVGVALRTIDPSLRGKRLLWGRRARHSVVALRRGLAKRTGHLHALEEVFDRTVMLAEARDPDSDRHELAHEVARWVGLQAREELLRREIDSEWLDALETEQLERLEAELEQELAELVHEWSLPA